MKIHFRIFSVFLIIAVLVSTISLYAYKTLTESNDKRQRLIETSFLFEAQRGSFIAYILGDPSSKEFIIVLQNDLQSNLSTLLASSSDDKERQSFKKLQELSSTAYRARLDSNVANSTANIIEKRDRALAAFLEQSDFSIIAATSYESFPDERRNLIQRILTHIKAEKLALLEFDPRNEEEKWARAKHDFREANDEIVFLLTGILERVISSYIEAIPQNGDPEVLEIRTALIQQREIASRITVTTFPVINATQARMAQLDPVVLSSDAHAATSLLGESIDKQLKRLEEKGILVVEKREIAGVGSANGIQILISLIKTQQQMSISAEDYVDSKLAIENQIDNFYTPIHDEFNRILDDVQSHQKKSLSLDPILISLIVISISAIFLLGYLLYRSILIPIKSLGKVAREITAGNLMVAPDTKGNDEITELSVQFDNMRRNILAVNTNLNDLVRARTSELERANEGLRKREQQLEVKNAELMKLDKLKDEFVNIAAHELRTPLLPIILSCENLADEIGGNNHNIQVILRNAERINRLTNMILDVSRIESNTFSLRKERINIVTLLEETVHDTRLRIAQKSNVKMILVSNIPKERQEIMIDKVRISQVLFNLLNNALEFTNEGTITVAVQNKQHNNDDNLEVRITDTGEGIDESIKNRLFQKFVTKSRKGSGTGLGLYLCKAIVEAHGGRIWAKNNDGGKGATFAFTLPLKES